MHEYNHFISGNRLLRWYFVQYNHHAALVHTLRQRKKREKQRQFNGKNTASSSQQYYFLGYLWFFFKEPADKKKTKIGEKTGEAATVVPGIRVASRTLWTTTNKLEAGPAANKRPRQRGTDASFTYVLLRSCGDVRRPRHLPNAKTAAISQPDADGITKNKYRISEIPRPGRYCTNIKLNNRKNK